MGLFRLLFNILWLVLGGFFMGLMWWLVGILCFISIIGIPYGRSCFVIGEMAFWPFGQEAISRRYINQRHDIGTGTLGTIANIIWFLVFGIWLAIGHIGSAIACFVTIIGIPFGIQHIKLAMLTLAPVGKTVVPRRM